MVILTKFYLFCKTMTDMRRWYRVPYLYKTVTAQNKDDLQLVMFPNLKITFDELFDLGEY